MPQKPKELPALTPAQEEYCKIFVKSGTHSVARKKTGYRGPIATRAMRERIKELYRSAYDRLDIVDTKILRETAIVAFFDPATCYDSAGALLPLHEMPEPARKAVRSIKIEEKTDKHGNVSRRQRVQFIDKVDALELLSKQIGILSPQKTEDQGSNNGNQNVTFNMIFGEQQQINLNDGRQISQPETDNGRAEIGALGLNSEIELEK